MIFSSAAGFQPAKLIVYVIDVFVCRRFFFQIATPTVFKRLTLR